MAAYGELVDQFLCHVLVADYRESGLVHVPTEGGVIQSSRQQFAFEGIRCHDYSHPGIEGGHVFNRVALAIEG